MFCLAIKYSSHPNSFVSLTADTTCELLRLISVLLCDFVMLYYYIYNPAKCEVGSFIVLSMLKKPPTHCNLQADNQDLK